MTEEELLEAGYRKYTGEKIDVFFKLDLCIHVAKCLRGNRNVFDLKRRPWIKADEASPEEVARIIDTCPSGALKYIHK